MKHDVWSVQKWLGYLFEEEIDALHEIVEGLPAGAAVVNIGAGGGTSGLAFMEKLEASGGVLYTIDIQDESSPFGCLEGERDVFKSAGYNYLYGERWFQICGDSKEIGKSWDKGQVDLVFVDGDHSYDGCVGDIRAWLPHIKPGGFLAIHDYDKGSIIYEDDGKVRPAPKIWHTVDRAVEDELIGKFPTVCNVQSLIVFKVGDEQNEGED